MGERLELGEDIAIKYAGALHAIARADGEITVEEGSRLQALVAARSSVTIDPEMLFFDQTTPEVLGAALRASADRAAIGLALVEDAVVLATCDGDLNGKEARAIVRYARALGVTAEEIHGRTDQLDEWLSELG